MSGHIAARISWLVVLMGMLAIQASVSAQVDAPVARRDQGLSELPQLKAASATGHLEPEATAPDGLDGSGASLSAGPGPYLWPVLPQFADPAFVPRGAGDLTTAIIEGCERADRCFVQGDEQGADSGLITVREALAEAFFYRLPLDFDVITHAVWTRHWDEDLAWAESGLSRPVRHYLSTELSLGAVAEAGDRITLVTAAPAEPAATDAGKDDDARDGGGERDRTDIYTQSFNTVPPSGWTTYGEGPQYWAWREEGTSNWAWCNSDSAGSGTSIKEWLYQTSGVSCSGYTSLHMNFQSL